jgi:flagella basal body P-ring formation protein FlgA
MTTALHLSRTWIAVALAGALAAWIGLHAPSVGATVGRVTVARQASVAGPEMRLGEIAELEGEAARFADLSLGRSPAAGDSVRLGGESILRRLRAAGLEPDAVLYSIPPSVRVTRAFQEISDHELREAIRARVEAGLGAGESIDDIGLPQSLRVPLGAYAIEVDEPLLSASRTRRADVRIVQADEVVARVAARVTIAAIGPVVVTRRAIERGGVIGAADVDVEERSLGAQGTQLVHDPADAIGKQARVAIPAGRPISASSLAAQSVVRKGDAVQLLIETAAMRLSVAGEALEDAATGEVVRVTNPSSGRELTGRAVAHGVVVVAR